MDLFSNSELKHVDRRKNMPFFRRLPMVHFVPREQCTDLMQ